MRAAGTAHIATIQFDDVNVLCSAGLLGAAARWPPPAGSLAQVTIALTAAGCCDTRLHDLTMCGTSCANMLCSRN
jgi:hypothetical protein